MSEKKSLFKFFMTRRNTNKTTKFLIEKCYLILYDFHWGPINFKWPQITDSINFWKRWKSIKLFILIIECLDMEINLKPPNLRPYTEAMIWQKFLFRISLHWGEISTSLSILLSITYSSEKRLWINENWEGKKARAW